MTIHSSQAIWRNRFEHNRNGQVFSFLLPYSSLILCICCICTFAARYYIIEPLVKRFYGTRYTGLDEKQRRSLVNHVVAMTLKAILLVHTAYPAIAVLAGTKTLHSPASPHSKVTIGDLLMITWQLFATIYIFELFYRAEISIISVLHHLGAIIISQTALVLGLDSSHNGDANIELILCLLWGLFDVVIENASSVAILLYRWNPKRHGFLAKLFIATAIIELVSTVIETCTIMSIFGLVWSSWTIEFKILTPPLHLLFSMAQLHGVRIFIDMSKSQKKKARSDVESVVESIEQDLEKVNVVIQDDDKKA